MRIAMDTMSHQHVKFLKACKRLAQARRLFRDLADRGVISGNDNHIGDIGEYWVFRYYDASGMKPGLSPTKVSPYDIALCDGSRVAVRTLSAWSKTKQGLPVELDESKWTILAAVKLGDDLTPEKIAIVPYNELRKQDVFKKERKRAPKFRWWTFLHGYQIKVALGP